MCSAASSKGNLLDARCSRSSSTTESTPPLRPATSRSPRLIFCIRTWVTRASSALLDGDFLVLAITHQPLEPRFEQFFSRFVLQRAPGILQCLLQVLHHRIVIAMGTTQRLGYDLVNQAESLETGCGDAECLRRYRGILRTLP